MTRAYLLGVLHDATERNTTYRIASKSRAYCEFLKRGIEQLDSRAWIYKEGKQRDLWVVEFSKSLLRDVKINSEQDKIDYARGYFDTEGGIAKSPKVRYYLFLAQKNKVDLLQVKTYLEEFGISCGVMHNPRKKGGSGFLGIFLKGKVITSFG